MLINIWFKEGTKNLTQLSMLEQTVCTGNKCTGVFIWILKYKLNLYIQVTSTPNMSAIGYNKIKL